VFQNGKISSLANMTKDWSGMVFDVGVAYKENTDEVTAVVKQVADDLQAEQEFGASILEPLEIFGVDSFGDSAVTIKARFKTRPGDQWKIGREFNRRLKLAFDKHHIEIPFPHRTLTWGEGAGPVPWAQKGDIVSTSEKAPAAAAPAAARRTGG
jgi:small conductance mechanosensitive channel